MTTRNIAVLTLADGMGDLTLKTGASTTLRFVWFASKTTSRDLADFATRISNPPEYEYGPADGEPGCLAAQNVQQALGGKLRILVKPTGRGDGIDGSELPPGVTLSPVDSNPDQPGPAR